MRYQQSLLRKHTMLMISCRVLRGRFVRVIRQDHDVLLEIRVSYSAINMSRLHQHTNYHNVETYF